MKAPLRSLTGWVVFTALYAAINPIASVIWAAATHQNPVVSIGTAVIALAILIYLSFRFAQPFYAWCDQPRAAAPNTPHEVK